MFCAARSYPNGLSQSDLAPLNLDIRTLLVTEGFIEQGGFIENGRVSSSGTRHNWDINSYDMSMTADDWTYLGGFAAAPYGVGMGTLPVTSACEVVVAGSIHEGWFWVLIQDVVSPAMLSLTAAISLRPHAVDEDDNLIARFGVFSWTHGTPARVALPGVVLTDGSRLGELICGTWSPLTGSLRHPANLQGGVPASSLPRMIAPLFPDTGVQPPELNSNASLRSITACVPGELDCVMRATNGYAIGEQAAPNWFVYGDPASGWHALRRPATITTF